MERSPYQFAAVGKRQASFGDANYTLVQRALPGAVTVAAAVSRKTHGAAGVFDVPLPLSGNPGVEPRGAGGSHTIVFTFANRLASVGSAAITSGTGQVSSGAIDPVDAHQYVINLSNVADGQRLTINLADVNDLEGNRSANVPLTVAVLGGDGNGDGLVNIGDTLQTRARVGQTTEGTNFRYDFNRDGIINAGDVIYVRSRSGSALNP
jgi:hypothetical protein